MTLNLMIINPCGIWQSADYRGTDPYSRKVVDDYLQKQIVLHCSDGHALIAFAGVGSVKVRYRTVSIAHWVLQILRGEDRTLDQSLILLRERATEDLGPIVEGQHAHMFTVGAVLGGRLWAVQIRNFEATSSGEVLVKRREFTTVAKQVFTGQAVYFAVPPNFVCADDIVRLTKTAKRRPRQPKEFRHLLAAVNRRAASHKPGARYVSPHCITAYLTLQGAVEQEFHEVKAPPKPVIPLVLLRGIDTHYRYEFMAQSYAAARGEGTVDNSRETYDRLGHESVTPRNPLRRFMRFSSVSSMGAAALPSATTNTRL